MALSGGLLFLLGFLVISIHGHGYRHCPMGYGSDWGHSWLLNHAHNQIRSYKHGNSDEWDSREEKVIYRIKPSEGFTPPCFGVNNYVCNSSSFYRNFDGSCNNLVNPSWGVPNSTYTRLLPARYSNGIRRPRRGVKGNDLPNARRIRTSVFPTGSKVNLLWNINAMIFGQFMAHDMSLLRQPKIKFACCTPDGKYVSKTGRFCYPIKVPWYDPTMGMAGIRCLNFTRTVTDQDIGCPCNGGPAQQINTVTDTLDLSNVYGLDKAMSDGLRALTGGLLKTETRNGHIFAPTLANKNPQCRCSQAGETTCFQTGDSRSNQNPHLAILQILFVREHNRIAKQLAAINPQWNDEKLFQEARRISIAAYQRIVYYEWLPIFLGFKNVTQFKITYNTTGFVSDYDPTINFGVSNEHAHAANRFFHTHIVGLMSFLDSNRTATGQTFRLSDWFNRPALLEKNATNMEQLTMDMITQNLEESDNIYVEDVTDKLFACGKQYGIDLRAADIQRDRDHGLAYYNDYREYCGLPRANCFDDYADVIPAQQLELLKNLYIDYRDVDLSVGGALETLAKGAQVGPTFLCILKDQFLRTRMGDRLFFEHPESGFTADQLLEIRKASITGMFCNNGDGVVNMQPHGFTLIISPFNLLQPCSNIPQMNLTLWKA